MKTRRRIRRGTGDYDPDGHEYQQLSIIQKLDLFLADYPNAVVQSRIGSNYIYIVDKKIAKRYDKYMKTGKIDGPLGGKPNEYPIFRIRRDLFFKEG